MLERLAVHTHDEARVLRERVLTERAPVEREFSVGGQHYVLRLAAVRDEQEAPLGLVAALADVTEQRALQQTHNDVMALVTHELKTPLTAIQGMSNVLAEFDDERLETERRRAMHLAINDEAKRLARMIDAYLNLARLESGTQALRLSSVRPAQLLERALLLLDPLAAQRGIRLPRAFPNDLPPLLADADLLTQAVTNLGANALKFSPAQTVVSIAARADDVTLHIAITDQGCGIPAASLPHLFEKFYRVPRVEEADAPGTGLGLALMREVAERHGRRVTVESGEGSGATFTLHYTSALTNNNQSPSGFNDPLRLAQHPLTGEFYCIGSLPDSTAKGVYRFEAGINSHIDGARSNVVAGTASPGTGNGDGGPAALARFILPQNLAFDRVGCLRERHAPARRQQRRPERAGQVQSVGDGGGDLFVPGHQRFARQLFARRTRAGFHRHSLWHQSGDRNARGAEPAVADRTGKHHGDGQRQRRCRTFRPALFRLADAGQLLVAR